MIINNLNASNNSNRQQVIAYAQTIMNFFTDAVEQNDCNVKIVIGFYTEIQDTVNSIKDLENAFNQPVYQPDYWKDSFQTDWTLPDLGNTLVPSLDNPDVIIEVKEAVKSRCFNCKLKLPTVQLTFDKAFLFNKLSTQLEIYKVTFKGKLEFSLCQASFMFQRTCIPDLIRLIGLFLSAYAAILALKKLPKISLGVFVKAIIGQLMAKVVASLKLTIDMNSTGIPCIVTALKDIAHAMPTNENMKARLSAEQYGVIPPGRTEGLEGVWPKDYKPISEFTKEVQASVKNGTRTQAEADKILDDYKRKNDSINYHADKLQRETDRVQSQIDSGIKMITDIVDNAVEDVNSYIDSILGTINFLQCEDKRTGSDFSEVMEYISKIQEVINLISAIIAYMAKQFFRTDLCKDAKTVEQLKEAIINAPIPDLTTPDAIAEITQEWSGSIIKIDSEGLNLLVYDQPAKPMLPKLTLIGCNFREFAAAHTLDNILKAAADAVAEEDKDPSIVPGFSSTDVPRPTWIDTDPALDPVDPLVINIPTNPYPWTDTDSDTSGTTDTGIGPYRDPDNGTIINDTVVPKKPGNTGGSNDDNTHTDVVPGGNTTNNPTKPDPKTPRNPNNPVDTGDVNNPVQPTDVPGVTATIPINPTRIGPIFKDWVDTIDDIVDFIYNPTGDPTISGTDPVTGDTTDTTDEDTTISFYQFKENDEQKKYHPTLQECRSVEDVIAILQDLKL